MRKDFDIIEKERVYRENGLDAKKDVGFESTGLDIQEAKLRTIQYFPSLASVVKNFTFQNDGSGTEGGVACTDTKSIIKLNAVLLSSAGIEAAVDIIAHEALHTEESAEGLLGNIASDGVINARLRASGRSMKLGGIDIPNAIQMGTQAIYAFLNKAIGYVNSVTGSSPDADSNSHEFTREEVISACYGNYALWARLVNWVKTKDKEKTQSAQPELALVF